MSLSPSPAATIAPARARDAFWDHSRNSLGIARLLAREDRPGRLVGTACHMAAEMACRAALEQAGRRFDGDLEAALDDLSLPRHVLAELTRGGSSERLAAAETVVGWVASYLRNEAPERNWGF